MSAAFVPFLYELRARKVKVGAQEAMMLARALAAGLHESSLDGFYHVARALCVHREQDLDAFDQAFSSHFKGIELLSMKLLDELEEWLKNARERKALTAEERAMLESIDMEELRKLFEQRMREQKERHDGGNKWIGTGGTSPFGAGGTHPSGLRIGPQGGQRSAMGIADARRYKPYRSDLVLDVRQIEVALRKLRAFKRDGVPDELDLDETIARTSKNAGELEIVMRPQKKPRTRVLLLMDVGGSMDPHAHLVSRLFSAARRASNIRELKTYYFHNCIYGRLYATERFQEPVRVRDVLDACTPEHKLVVVGDAAMHPGELLGSSDWEYLEGSGEDGRSAAQPGQQRTERMPGIRWMMLIADHFHRSVWLNPDEEQYWRGGTAETLASVFSMFPLTLDGLGRAVTHLSKGEPRRS